MTAPVARRRFFRQPRIVIVIIIKLFRYAHNTIASTDNNSRRVHTPTNKR